MENFFANQPASLKVILNHATTQSIIGALLIYLGFYILNKIVKKYVFPLLERLARKSRNDYDDKVLAAFYGPIEWFILLTGIYMALRYLPLSPALDNLILNLFRSLIIILITWGFYALVDGYSPLAMEFENRFNIDHILIAFFSKTARFVLICMALVVIAQEWDYDVNGFIAGLGLGGLAFALAAKDILANIFGGIVIIIEKPFTSGDWISTPSVEGVVETITFRTTRVRAFNESLINVPNATLANEPITNYSRMGKRRVDFHLGVTYNTPRVKIQECVTRINNMLKNHPEVHPETIMVYFEHFNDSSLDIKIYFFTITTKWEEYLAVRQDVNLKIMEILEELEVSIAFPSHSIYIETNPLNINNSE